MASVILECRDLSKVFSYGKNQSLKAVDGVSLKICQGEVYGLVGESGSGKSTLSNMICALEKPGDGQVIFNGRDISSYNKKEMLDFRRKMQVIFQDPYATLNPKHKISYIIEEPLKIHKIGENPEIRRRLVNEIRIFVGLSPQLMDKYPSQLSGGQRQRVAIASAMILQPDFVICDECVSSLDVILQNQILTFLKKMQKNLKLTYLFISHNLNVVAFMADRIGVMYRGKIIEEKSTQELLKNPEHPYTKKLLEAADLID